MNSPERAFFVLWMKLGREGLTITWMGLKKNMCSSIFSFHVMQISIQSVTMRHNLEISVPDLSLKDRMLLWWSATKLLMGSDAAPQVRRRLDAALNNRSPHDHDPSRWDGFRPHGGQGDGRWWLMNGHPRGQWIGSGATHRSILVRALWEYGSDFAKQAVHQRWSVRFPEPPEDVSLATIDAWLSQDTTDNLAEVNLANATLEEKDLTWLGYWACASNDPELMNLLTNRRSLEKWEDIDNACVPWLGWCSLMGRKKWTENALAAGMEINHAQSFRHGFVEKLKKLREKGFPELGLLSSPVQATAAAVKKKFGIPLVFGNGFNALRWAADVDSVEVVDALLYNGPNLYEQDAQNETLLDLSIARHAWEICVSLAKHGARLGLDKKKEFESLSNFAGLLWSEHASSSAFVELGQLLVDRVGPAHPKHWNESATAWANVMLCCAKNKDVHPEFVAGVMKASKTPGHWRTWQLVISKEGGMETKENALDLAINASNGAFLSAVAGNGIELDYEYLESSLLSFLIWLTPTQIKPWLDKTTPATFEKAWTHNNSTITRGEDTLWKSGTACSSLSLACSDPRAVLAMLAWHPVSSATIKKLPINAWASLAMKQERVEAVEAVKESVGTPTWKADEVSSGWEHASRLPRNEAMINKVLEWGWPVNVAVDDSGLSLLRAVAEKGDASLVQRLAAHGADPAYDDGVSRGSLFDWLSSHDDQKSVEPIRCALSQGQAIWLGKSTRATMMDTTRPLSSPARRL